MMQAFAALSMNFAITESFFVFGSPWLHSNFRYASRRRQHCDVNLFVFDGLYRRLTVIAELALIELSTPLSK